MQSLLSAATVLASAPLLRSGLGESTYGVWAGMSDFLAWALTADVGAAGVVVQQAAAAVASNNRLVAKQVLGSALAVTIAAGGSVGIVLLFVGHSYVARMDVGGEIARTMLRVFGVGILAMVGSAIYSVIYSHARGAQRAEGLSIGSLVGGLVMLGATVGGLIAGWALYSLAAGWMARLLIQLALAARYLRDEGRTAPGRWLAAQPSVQLLRQIPASALHSAAFAIAANSETVLIALRVGPEAAGLYSLARRAFDLAKSLADSVCHGAFGALAYASATGRLWQALGEAWRLRLLVAVACMAATAAANGSFVAWWAGAPNVPEQLTFAVGMGALVLGQAYLLNLAVRSTGAHGLAAAVMAGEAAARVGLAWLLLPLLGPVGAPAAGALIGTASLFFQRAVLVSRAKGTPTVAISDTLVLLLAAIASAAGAWLVDTAPDLHDVLLQAVFGAGVGVLVAAAVAFLSPRRTAAP